MRISSLASQSQSLATFDEPLPAPTPNDSSEPSTREHVYQAAPLVVVGSYDGADRHAAAVKEKAISVAQAVVDKARNDLHDALVLFANTYGDAIDKMSINRSAFAKSVLAVIEVGVGELSLLHRFVAAALRPFADRGAEIVLDGKNPTKEAISRLASRMTAAANKLGNLPFAELAEREPVRSKLQALAAQTHGYVDWQATVREATPALFGLPDPKRNFGEQVLTGLIKQFELEVHRAHIRWIEARKPGAVDYPRIQQQAANVARRLLRIDE